MRSRAEPRLLLRWDHVVSVSGSRAEIAVNTTACSQDREDPLSVGKLLTLHAGTSRSVALIYEAESGGDSRPDVMLARVELLGEVRPGVDGGRAYFDRGIRTYPPVGAIAHEIDPETLETIYQYDGTQTITIGTLAQDARTRPVCVPESPLYEFQLERLLADQVFKRGDARLVGLDEVGCLGVVVKRARLVPLDPDTDQVARDVVALGQTMKRLASQKLLGDLTLELDAVGSVFRHGFHPLKARLPGQFG